MWGTTLCFLLLLIKAEAYKEVATVHPLLHVHSPSPEQSCMGLTVPLAATAALSLAKKPTSINSAALQKLVHESLAVMLRTLEWKWQLWIHRMEKMNVSDQENLFAINTTSLTKLKRPVYVNHNSLKTGASHIQRKMSSLTWLVHWSISPFMRGISLLVPEFSWNQMFLIFWRQPHCDGSGSPCFLSALGVCAVWEAILLQIS